MLQTDALLYALPRRFAGRETTGVQCEPGLSPAERSLLISELRAIRDHSLASSDEPALDNKSSRACSSKKASVRHRNQDESFPEMEIDLQ